MWGSSVEGVRVPKIGEMWLASVSVVRGDGIRRRSLLRRGKRVEPREYCYILTRVGSFKVNLL